MYVIPKWISSDWEWFKCSISSETISINDSDILQGLHNDSIIFCMSWVNDGTILWMLTGTEKMWYSKTVSLAIWDMALEASTLYPLGEFAKYFKTL